MTTETVKTVNVEDVLNEIIPVGGYARLVAPASDAERFWFRGPRGFISMSGSPSETFEDFARSFGNEASFSPVPWGSYNIGSAPLPLHALWARVPIALTGPRPQCPAPSVDAEHAALVRARLNACDLPPTIAINAGGDALVAFWTLSVPMSDLALARRLLLWLATHLEGDRAMADLNAALIRIPGTRNTTVFPARDVTIETWDPERVYTVEQVENWLSASGKGLRA
jgi:hypothetical protein